jgi:hypothetical protein
MDFSFFTTNNKSGYKTSEKWFSKNYPKEYNDIIEYSKKVQLNGNFKEKIWFYFNQITERPKCVSCGDEISFRNRFDKPYGDFCSLICFNHNKDEMINRQKKTFIKKYGVNFFPEHESFIYKQREKKKLKYGNQNYNNPEKIKKTKKERYGDVNFNNQNQYQKTCLNKYGTNNYSKSNHYKNKIKLKFIEKYPNINITEIKKETVTIQCDICKNDSSITKQLLYERYKRTHNCCLTCNPIGFNNRSEYEKEICNFLTEKNIEYQTNVKIPNENVEIDIFIPLYNLGIEFNGVYWHNELFKTKNYHLEKTIKCEKNGINLIHIFEDEWIYKREILKSIILNKVNKTDKIIYGRKCTIKEISSIESKKFLDENHIQGNVNSKVKIGLFYENILVSVMTFSKGRIIMGGKNTEWELNRFCNLLNTNIIGSASKLLNFFIKNYSPEKIVSYSDIRLFNGDMYKKIGFNLISQSKPNYWYVINGIRKHRFNYTKSKLIKEGYEKNKTEKEIMFERKIYRIYDCGNIRWEYNFKKNLVD